ncbi:MAG: glutamine--fructose-6-phosphate transaminase (isomerizing) [Hellea sp.]|nr:glutamine--fructose-6-phosphate transaminase (isomerizing) [Hellea sp.]
MCGIVGIVGTEKVTDRLIDGLKRLEYRGYDSAGVAVLNGSGLKRARAKGKIASLVDALEKDPIDGHAGIAHTRWATHGKPNINNAHPHFAGKVGVVHNGIIENYQDIRRELNGRNFSTDTDTEVIAHVMDEALKSGLTSKEAFSQTLKKLRGAYALGIMVDDEKDEIFAARAGSPLAIGIGNGEMYLGSDALALAQLSRELIYLEEGDWAVLSPAGYEIFDENDQPVKRDVTVIQAGAMSASDKGEYEHYMLKEIHEQPITVNATLKAYLGADDFTETARKIDFTAIDRLVIIACGTASYAGEVAKYWFEQIAGLAVDVDIASEFRYRQPVLSKNSLFVAVSQSGETADTLAALRYCKQAGIPTAALVNVMTSTMAREADIALPLNAGPEIGVASTKAFTSQLTALATLAVLAASQRAAIDEDGIAKLTEQLSSLSNLVSKALTTSADIAKLAEALAPAKHAFFLGRGAMTPVAFEGALKLKEISYIHAEGYAAGELKHGPIALIEQDVPVIVIAPHDELFEKTVSNMQEVAARGARIYLFTDEDGAKAAGHMAHSVIVLPKTGKFLAPLVQTIGVQLLAYHTATALGTDVDQPRNLAKSVTVE